MGRSGRLEGRPLWWRKTAHGNGPPFLSQVKENNRYNLLKAAQYFNPLTGRNLPCWTSARAP